jgi:hypothetical protein
MYEKLRGTRVTMDTYKVNMGKYGIIIYLKNGYMVD